MHQIRVATFGILGVIALIFVAQAQESGGPPASGGTDDAYRPPRTSWGDPDLEGKWPSTNMAGVPLQRPESFGTRNVLTDAEFAERQAQAARQVDQDNADFDFENPSVPFGQVGGGQSPPQHWFERGETQRQASLIVDPPNGRLPALTAAAQKREADRRASASGAAGVVHGLLAVRAVHHARPHRLRHAGRLQQRQSNLPGARLRDHRQRDDPRVAHRAARRPAAPEPGDSQPSRRLARPVGRRHAGGRDEEHRRPHGRGHEQHRRQRGADDHRALHPHERHHAPLPRSPSTTR